MSCPSVSIRQHRILYCLKKKELQLQCMSESVHGQGKWHNTLRHRVCCLLFIIQQYRPIFTPACQIP
jgi:hypothetical protein